MLVKSSVRDTVYHWSAFKKCNTDSGTYFSKIWSKVTYLCFEEDWWAGGMESSSVLLVDVIPFGHHSLSMCLAYHSLSSSYQCSNLLGRLLMDDMMVSMLKQGWRFSQFTTYKNVPTIWTAVFVIFFFFFSNKSTIEQIFSVFNNNHRNVLPICVYCEVVRWVWDLLSKLQLV